MWRLDVERASVLIFEPDGRVRGPELFAAIAQGLARRDGLLGLVIRARELPGREIGASLVRHTRFVWAHRSNIDRVALATDSPLFGPGLGLAELVIGAELKLFAFVAVERAIRWCARPVTAALHVQLATAPGSLPQAART
jgi:hypothetical protein